MATATRNPNGSGKFSPPPEGARTEKTGPQAPTGANGVAHQHVPHFFETAFTLGMLLAANGGTPANPMGFPGYENLYTGGYTTLRWIRKHPVVALIRSIRMGIIGANEWEYVKVHADDNVPEDWLTHTRRTFDPIRQHLIWEHMAPGHDFGWSGGEPVWEYDDFFKFFRLIRVKPLSHEITEVLVDAGGNPVGLQNGSVREPNQSGPVKLAMPYKAFLFTYQKEFNQIHGQSWMENIRTTAWKGWLDSAQQLQKLGAKISGTVTIITSPAGTFPGPAGPDGKPTQISFRKNAEEVIKALANGAAGAWFPSLGLNPDGKGGLDAMKVMAQLIGKSMTNVDVKDFPGSTRAIGPILEKMKHEEELMFNGGGLSARTGLESEHGSRADAGEHTNTATFNAEDNEEKFCSQLQPLVDADLMMNKTPKAKGRVRIKPRSLVDRKTAVFKAMLLGLLNNEDVAVSLVETPGLMDSLLSVLDVISEGKFSVDEFKKRQEQKRKDESAKKTQPRPGTPEPEGGRPKQE
jgi:hypothetical protein